MCIAHIPIYSTEQRLIAQGSEPVAYSLTSLNRTAVIVRPARAFYDFFSALDSAQEVNDEHGTVYLVREVDSDEMLYDAMEEVFPTILENELAARGLGRDQLPTSIDIDFFRKVFDIRYHHLVIDLADEPLETDRYDL